MVKVLPFTHPFTVFLFQTVPLKYKNRTFVNYVYIIQYKMNDNKLKTNQSLSTTPAATTSNVRKLVTAFVGWLHFSLPLILPTSAL